MKYLLLLLLFSCSTQIQNIPKKPQYDEFLEDTKTWTICFRAQKTDKCLCCNREAKRSGCSITRDATLDFTSCKDAQLFGIEVLER